MASGLAEGLEGIARIEARGDLTRYHLLPAAKADLLRRAGRVAEAADAYRAALALVTSPAERRYLEGRLAEVDASARQKQTRRSRRRLILLKSSPGTFFRSSSAVQGPCFVR